MAEQSPLMNAVVKLGQQFVMPLGRGRKQVVELGVQAL